MSQRNKAIAPYPQLHAAKLNLARATEEVKARIESIDQEFHAAFINGRPSILWARMPDELYLSNIKQWLQAPRTNCAPQKIVLPPIDSKKLLAPNGQREYQLEASESLRHYAE